MKWITRILFSGYINNQLLENKQYADLYHAQHPQGSLGHAKGDTFRRFQEFWATVKEDFI